MSLGVILLAHTRFDRVAQLVEYWRSNSCPVAIHLDKKSDTVECDKLRERFANDAGVHFIRQYHCEWGRWGLVEAAQTASLTLITEHSDLSHVILTSGSCLPLRPIEHLKVFLSNHPETDFIESVNTLDVRWAVGGLEEERFSYYYPFPWKTQKKLFDLSVSIQRRTKKFIRRQPPSGLNLHLGSQWWCLSLQTLKSIHSDVRKQEYDRFFKWSWIPDESYFQTLARVHSKNIISRSLTLSKFDQSGRPHVFYDDHLSLLKRSDCYIARKIWPNATALYDEFLSAKPAGNVFTAPKPEKIDRIFERARLRRTQGRPGLYMASRFPSTGHDAVTAMPYSVFYGFESVMVNFRRWLAGVSEMRVHGHLFAPNQVEFSDNSEGFFGALSNSIWIRDYKPSSFLSNLIWNSRGERQAFMLGPRDNQKVFNIIASDRNATISMISGSFLLALSARDDDFDTLRLRAARLQRREDSFIRLLNQPWVSANVSIISLSDFLKSSSFHIEKILGDHGVRLEPFKVSEKIEYQDMSEFLPFVQRLKNSGINPYLLGDLNSDWYEWQNREVEAHQTLSLNAKD